MLNSNYVFYAIFSFHVLWSFALSANTDLTPAPSEAAAVQIKSVADQNIAGRLFRTFILPNKLEVLLISDAKVTKSAASLDVNVGNMADPLENLGMAHFLEHMLFLGTQKYPDSEAFSKFLNENQGSSNAYTADENTNYHFEISHQAFEEGLDRFGQFFVAPLFDPAYVEREKNAVHSEYQKNLQNDGWRQQRIDQMLSKKGHPVTKFSIGTLETLKSVTRENLLKFYQTYYSANLMKLSLLSNASLDDMEKWVANIFSGVPNANRAKLTYEADLFDDNDLPALIQIKPVQEQRQMTLQFECPASQTYWESKPYIILGHLIGHEGEGSLLSLLKKENLATALSAGLDSKSFASSFNINMTLTEQGFQRKDAIIGHVFSYIKLLQQNGYKKYVYDEEKTMLKLGSLYQDREEGTDEVIYYASQMHNHPPLLVDRNLKLLHTYSPADFDLFVTKFTPANLRVILMAPETFTDQTEAFFGTHFSVTKFPAAIITGFENVSVHPALYYPQANPFIPTNLTYLGDEPTLLPEKIIDDEQGVFWFKQDNEFKLPKALVKYTLVSDQVGSTWKKLLAHLYVAVINEQLNEWKYPASVAGLDFSIKSTYQGIQFNFGGYSEKIPQLITAVTSKLKEINLSPERFATIKRKLIRDLTNFSYSAAYEQTFREQDILLNRHIEDEQKYLPLIEMVTLSDLAFFGQMLFAQVAIQGMGYGNLRGEQLQQAITSIFSQLDAEKLPQTRWPQEENLFLPPGKSFAYAIPTKTNNNCWTQIYQMGARSDKLNAIIRVADAYISSGFYHEMRTNQQLGYIVWSYKSFASDVLGLGFTIQSGDYAADEIAKRARTWLGGVGKAISQIGPDQLNMLKDRIIEKLVAQPQKQSDQFSTYWFEAFTLKGNFGYNQKVVSALQELTLEEVVTALNDTFSYEHKQATLTIYASKEGAPLVKVDGQSEVAIENVAAFKRSL